MEIRLLCSLLLALALPALATNRAISTLNGEMPNAALVTPVQVGHPALSNVVNNASNRYVGTFVGNLTGSTNVTGGTALFSNDSLNADSLQAGTVSRPVTNDAVHTTTAHITGTFAAGTITATNIAGNGRSLSNTVDIIAGSGVSVTTNADKRSFTLSATGGGTATNAIANLNGTGTNTDIYASGTGARVFQAAGASLNDISGVQTIDGANRRLVSLNGGSTAIAIDFYDHNSIIFGGASNRFTGNLGVTGDAVFDGATTFSNAFTAKAEAAFLGYMNVSNTFTLTGDLLAYGDSYFNNMTMGGQTLNAWSDLSAHLHYANRTNSLAYSSGTGKKVLDSQVGSLYDLNGKQSVDWAGRQLYGLDGAGDPLAAADWGSRTLFNTNGATILDWSGGAGVSIAGSVTSQTITNSGNARIGGDLTVVGTAAVDGVDASGTISTSDQFSGPGTGLTGIPVSAIAAPSTTAWSGPTNAIVLSYPWTDFTMYSLTSDVSLTNITGWTTGKKVRASLVFTNSTTSNCTIRLPVSWWRWGTALATNSVTVTNGGRMLKLDIEAASTTNAIGAFAQ